MDELFPASVFFAGKQATTQLRNSGGVQASDDKVTAFALVDAGGYSSGIRERFQFYLLTSVAVEVAGKRLEAGSYGGGFLNGQALLMDLSAKEVFHAAVSMDAEMRRPRPLQVAGTAKPGEYRLYLGREYVSFRQIP